MGGSTRLSRRRRNREKVTQLLYNRFRPVLRTPVLSAGIQFLQEGDRLSLVAMAQRPVIGCREFAGLVIQLDLFERGIERVPFGQQAGPWFIRGGCPGPRGSRFSSKERVGYGSDRSQHHHDANRSLHGRTSHSPAGLGGSVRREDRECPAGLAETGDGTLTG